MHHQAADTCTTRHQVSAFFVVADQIMQRHPSPQTIVLVRLASALRDQIDISLINQRLHKLGYRSTSLYNICVQIFDRLRQRLRVDHTATPTIFTEHRYHTDLLDALSPRQPNLRLYTAPTFNTAETTRTLHSNSDSTPMHSFRVRFAQ